jgi:hypothetical protein
MAKIRRIIRKVEPPHEAALDEQLWPVNLALVVLGAFSLGATLAYLRFDDPTWWKNAWTYVVLTPLVVCGAMLAFRLVDNKLFRRSMQLAVVASAMAHLAMVILSAESVIFTTLLVESKTKSQFAETRAPDVRFDLRPDLLMPDENEPRDFEKPIETETPEVDPAPVVKKETPLEESSPRKPQPVPIPEPKNTQQPAIVKRPTSEEAAPREAPSRSLLSRNNQPREISPSGARIEAAQPVRSAPQASVSPTVAGMERKATENRPLERSPTDEPSAPQPREAVAIAKRTADVAPRPDTTATATLKRQVNQPALTPKSQIDNADVPSVAKRTSPTEPTPNNTAAVRRTTVSPDTRRTEIEPRLEPSSQVAVRPRATSNSPSRISPATTPPIASSPGAGRNTPTSVARATREAQLPTAQANIASPATSGGEGGTTAPATTPARLGLSRSQSGMAGAGNSPNLDRGTGAGDSPALSASVAARRREATSNGPADAALTPSTLASRAHSRAAAGTPSTSLQADTLANATEGGAPQVGELVASSSAAMTRANGNAARGDASAAKGTADIDIGATTIVAEGGQGRASGGGQPQLSFDPRMGNVARQQSPASAEPSTATEKIVGIPDAAIGTGGDGTETGLGGPANTATARQSTTSGSATGELPSVAEVAGAGQTNLGGSAIARAETGAAAESPRTSQGGDPNSPERANGGQAIAASAQADTVQLAGAPESGGGPEGVALQAQGITAAKTSGGATSRIVEGAIGAAAGDEVVDAFGPQGAGDVAGGMRTVSPGLEDGPSVSDVAASGGLGKRSTETNLEAAEPGQIEVPSVGPTSAVAQADLDHGMATGIGRAASDSGEGVIVNIDAPEGVGGIGNQIASDVGLNTRLARSDSLEIGPQPTRFVGRSSGGVPGISVASVVPTESYKKRAEGRAGRGKLPPQTETSIENGLQFLARFQQTDGSWRLQGMETSSRSDPQMVSDTAATALAVLAFQGAGYNHREHKYASVVRGGLDYLVRNQKENGDLFVPLDDQSNRSVWLYSHALAALALCEAYGMTQDPALEEPAQKAIDFIIEGQHKQRGGWRYAPGIGSDTSVTGTMLVALRSAELANLKVPQETYDGVTKWLDSAQASPSQAYLYRYNPQAPDTDAQRHGRVASPTMTSLGLLMRLYLGWKRDNPNMVQGADYLKQHLPALGTNTAPQRDTYYWYYATQVMFHMGGDHWKQWHEKLHKLLLDTQVKEGPFAGSWNPRLPVTDRWGPHGGRLYVTTLNLLSLEVQYRHLPTYEDTAK